MASTFLVAGSALAMMFWFFPSQPANVNVEPGGSGSQMITTTVVDPFCGGGKNALWTFTKLAGPSWASVHRMGSNALVQWNPPSSTAMGTYSVSVEVTGYSLDCGTETHVKTFSITVC